VSALFGLAKAAVSRLSDDGIRRVGRAVFVRTSKELRAAASDPRGAQTARLRTIMFELAGTEQGKRKGFDKVSSLEDLRARVPVCDWDDVAADVERMVGGDKNVLTAEDPIYYATSSGTTGRRKLIPVTSGFVAECRAQNRALYRTLLAELPGFVRGKRLAMRSPLTEVLAPGKEAGSITVALGGGVDDESALDAVPVDVFRVADFQTRYALALRFALQEHITIASAINPSTLMMFETTLTSRVNELVRGLSTGDFGVDVSAVPDDVLARLRPRLRTDGDVARRLDRSAIDGPLHMQHAFPALCGLVTWKGGASSWWLARLAEAYGPLPIVDYGYAASEGCFGAPVDSTSAQSLLLPHGHVVELLPEGEADCARTVSLDEAEPGQRYEVIATTSSGLVRYRMYDLVEVTGRLERAPLVVFRHKAGTMCSITGEKLGEAHVASALADVDFTGPGCHLVPSYPSAGGGVPGYRALVEADAPLALVVTGSPAQRKLHDVAARLDAALGRANEEYEAKRASGRLAPVVVEALAPGTYAMHRRRRVEAGAPDAHVKTPLISPSTATADALRAASSAVAT